MPLLWITFAFLTGILLGKWIPLPVVFWGVASAICLAWLIFDRARKQVWWHRITPLPPALILVLLCLGGMRMALAVPVVDDTSLSYYNDQGRMRLTGWISEPPDVREYAVYTRVKITELERLDQASGELVSRTVKGDCLVRLPAGAETKMGDVIQFAAEPRTPSDGSDFSYRDYLSRQGILSVVYFPQSFKVLGTHPVNPVRKFLEDLRQKARTTIFALFPQPESGLLSGILLGLDNDLPNSLQQAYRDTGTAHIIAISGFNMAVLAGLLMALASKAFNRYAAVIFTALGLALYSILVGGSPSVVRAAVMAVVAMGGHLIGRRSTGTTALCFTAAVMCLVNPFLPWDTSFQLSFAATLGLVLLGSPLKERAEKIIGRFVPEEQVPRVSGPVSEYFLFTLAAQFATLPVIILQFKRLSVSSLLSNPLVLPVQPAVLITGGLATVSGMLFKPLGRLGAVVAWPLLAYTNRVVALISRTAGSSIAVDRRLTWLIAVFCILALLIFLFRRPLEKLPGKLPFASICLVLITAAVAIWASVVHQPDGRLHLRLVRADSEVTTVFTTPKGFTTVLNPGTGVNELTSAISQTLDPWRNKVEVVLVTDRSAAKNLSAFDERLPVDKVYLAPSVVRSTDDQRPVAIDAALNPVNLSASSVLQLDEGAQLRLLVEDAQSTALLLEYQAFRVLLPGGVDPADLRALDPRVMAGLSAIILTPDDITRVPPHWWDQFHAGQILWADDSQPPDPAWVRLGGSNQIELISDGSDFGLYSQK